MIARCGTARTEYASNFPRRCQRVALLLGALALAAADASAQTYNYFAAYPNTGTWQNSTTTSGTVVTQTAYYTGSVPDGTTHYDAALTLNATVTTERRISMPKRTRPLCRKTNPSLATTSSPSSSPRA